MQLFLAVTPQEIPAVSRAVKSLCHVAYRIGPESSLLRRDLPPGVQGGMLSVSDLDAPAVTDPPRLSEAVLRECGRRRFSGVVLDFENLLAPDKEAFIRALAPALGKSRRLLFVPERCAAAGGIPLVNTALSGGNCQQRIQEAVSRYRRIALDLQRLQMDFSLPCRSGEGRPLTAEQLQKLTAAEKPAVFFSPDLCARYFTYHREGQTHFVLFDDAETLRRKIRLGNSLGVEFGFLMYPEVRDLLERIFQRP